MERVAPAGDVYQAGTLSGQSARRGRRAARPCDLLDERGLPASRIDRPRRSPPACARPPATGPVQVVTAPGLLTVFFSAGARARLRGRARPATWRPSPPGAAPCWPAASTRRRRSSRRGSRRSRTTPSTSSAPSTPPPRPSGRRSERRCAAVRGAPCAAEGGLLADALGPAPIAQDGALGAPPRPVRARAGTAEDVAFVIEAIREGELLHYGGRAPVRARSSPTSRSWRATGSTRWGSRAWPRWATSTAVGELADVIALCAQARAEGAPGAGRCGLAGGRGRGRLGAVPEPRASQGGGPGAPARPGAPGAERAGPRNWRLDARKRRRRPPSVDLSGDKVRAPLHGRRPPTDQEQVHRRPLDPGRLRGRDGHAAALHDRHGQRRRRRGRVGVPAARARLRAGPGVREARAALAGGRPARRVPGDHLHARRSSRSSPGIGQAGKTTVYIRKRNPKVDTDKPDKYNQYIAISTRCMHLGCPVRFVEAAERFICPCHGGVYDFTGKVDGGPPVRPLDRFYTRGAATASSRSARATRSTRSSSASRRATRPSRWTASASTSTRRGPPIRKSAGADA